MANSLKNIVNNLLEFEPSDNVNFYTCKSKMKNLEESIFSFAKTFSLKEVTLSANYKKYQNKFDDEPIEETALWFVHGLTNPNNETADTKKILTMLKAFVEDNFITLKYA